MKNFGQITDGTLTLYHHKRTPIFRNIDESFGNGIYYFRVEHHGDGRYMG